MADPLQNLQAMQALFQQPANAFSRSQSARLNMALNNIRRVQELEDQQAQTNARMKLEQMADTRARDLANLQRSTQLDIAEKSETRADLRAKDADKRADERNDAAEKKALRAAVRAAYDRYASAGGTKKLAEFGAEDDANTLYSLQGEIGKIQSALDDEKFGQAAELLKQQEKQLGSLVAPSKTEIEQVEMNAVNALSTGPTKAAYEFYTDAISDGVPHSVAVQSMLKTYPGAAPVFQSAVSMGATELQAAKMKSPEFVKGLDQLGRMRSTLVSQAMERQRPGGDQLLRSLISPAQATEQRPAMATPDALALPTEAAQTETTRATPVSGGGYGGIMGLSPILKNLSSAGQLIGTYAAEVPLTGLNWMAGGMKRVNEGAAERQATRERIVREYNLRNPQNPIQANPFW